MNELERRIDQVEQQSALHDKAIEALTTGYANLQESNLEINRKLDKLILLEEQSGDRFEHHKLQCQRELDERYVLQHNLRREVIEILQSVRRDDLENEKSRSNVFSNWLNVIWKLGTFLGIGFMIFQNIAK